MTNSQNSRSTQGSRTSSRDSSTNRGTRLHVPPPNELTPSSSSDTLTNEGEIINNEVAQVPVEDQTLENVEESPNITSMTFNDSFDSPNPNRISSDPPIDSLENTPHDSFNNSESFDLRDDDTVALKQINTIHNESILSVSRKQSAIHLKSEEPSLIQIQSSDKKNENRIFFVNRGDKIKQPQRYYSNSISTTKYILCFRIHNKGWKIGPWGKIGLPPKKGSDGKPIPGAQRRPFDIPYIQPPFIIQNIYEQFHRIANLYFLFIIILQLIPGLSPTGRFSTLLPFAIVIAFSFLKDMFEDMKRRIGDLKTNSLMKSTVFRKGSWREVNWKDVKVGDIIMVKNKERFPCDIVMLSTSQEQGLAYVETASLDGETNLKVKKALDDTIPIQGDEVANLVGRVVCQKPNKNLHKFNGRLLIQGPYIWKKDVRLTSVSQTDPELEGVVKSVYVKLGATISKGTPICELEASTQEKLTVTATHDCQVTKIPSVGESYKSGSPIWSFETRLKHLENTPIIFSADQQLLRGSSLRNTDWIIGLVVYTGHQSKLLMNQNATPHKSSRVEKLTNRFIIIIFALLGILSLICAIGQMIHIATKSKNEWYLKRYENGASAWDIIWSGISGFFTFIILFNNLVPISLYVSMEMAKFAQAYFMTQDREMYYDEKDIPTVVRSSSLNEELGQVEYIFSDKTGTLTRNKMDFLKYAVNGVVYGTGKTEIERANANRKGIIIENDRPPGFDENQEFRFWDRRISDDGWTTLKDSEDHAKFFRLLALCHTVIPEKDANGNVVYNASSPDEGALVKAAKYIGVEFVSRTTYSMTIKIQGVEETWQLLNILEFNSTRKRMSVIVRSPEGKLILFTKGADNVIYERLSKDDNQHADISLSLLENLADAGLRTLVCAESEIDEDFYVEWRKRFQNVLLITDPTEKELKMDEVTEEIEKNLHLVGVTAIEDLLQIGVPSTISDLKKGQIKIWILTGDKQETAKNIGFACDLLNTEMSILEPQGESIQELKENLKAYIEEYTVSDKRKNGLGLIVNGTKLGWIMENEHLKHLFLHLGTMCEAVVCCRVSPLQKSQVVSLVKDNLKSLTLAIGDGANDVPMIQAAHVGIGISGEEGQQAANASDYSFGQFRFLKRLLLVHGQYSYRRVSKLILYSFYKNIVLYLTQLWYVFFNAWSGTSVHDKWTISAFNVLFAFLPIMALGIFDRHISPTKAMEFPHLYARGHGNVYFDFWSFLGWILNAVYHSCICFFIPILSMYMPDNEGFPWYGTTRDMIGLGVTIFTAVLLTITGKVNLEMESYTSVHALANWGSLLIWWLFILIYASIYWILPYYVFVIEETYSIHEQYRTMITFRFYFTVILTAIIALAKDFIWKAFKRYIRNDLFYAVQNTTIPEIKMNMTLEERERITEEWKEQKEELLKRYPTKLKIKHYISPKVAFGLNEEPETKEKANVNRGFAFSQTPGQTELLNKVLSGSFAGPSNEATSHELQEIEEINSDNDDNLVSNSHSYGNLGTMFEV